MVGDCDDREKETSWGLLLVGSSRMYSFIHFFLDDKKQNFEGMSLSVLLTSKKQCAKVFCRTGKALCHVLVLGYLSSALTITTCDGFLCTCICDLDLLKVWQLTSKIQ